MVEPPGSFKVSEIKEESLREGLLICHVVVRPRKVRPGYGILAFYKTGMKWSVLGGSGYGS